MDAEVSFTQVQTSGPCDESEDEKLELGSTKTQVCKRQKRFFKRFWMQDLTQIHSRMHPLVSKESDLQRKNHSRDVGNGHKKRKAETISSRGAQTGFQESSPTTKAFSNFAEGQRRATTSSFPIPSFTKKKPEQTNQSLRSPSATIPTTKNRNSVTNERMTKHNKNKQPKRRTKSQAISATKKKRQMKLACSRVQTSQQYCDNDDCRKGEKPKKKKKKQTNKQSHKNRGSWRTWRLPGRLRNTTTLLQEERSRCSAASRTH
jgi:hypothetical protein